MKKVIRHPALLTLSLLLVMVLVSGIFLSSYVSTEPQTLVTESIEVPENEIAPTPTPLPEVKKPEDLSFSEITEELDELGPISSILMSQHGELLSESYFGRMNAGRTHNIKSASKSILSILVGIAIDRGYFEGTDQPIADFFPVYFEQNPDSVKASITIGDLLTMRSGLASTSRGSYGRWVISNNWVQYALNQPMRGTPGVDRIYSTGNTYLLAVALSRASGMSARQFAERYLFDPMDIRLGGWDRDPQGNYMGGNNMALRPRDLLKIGELMMNMGEYNGRQIVPTSWIVESVEPVTGRGNRLNYGYLWFRRKSNGYETVYAYGNGGQYLLILPELESVIAVTTRNGTAEPTRTYRRELFSTIDRVIVPKLSASFDPERL